MEKTLKLAIGGNHVTTTFTITLGEDGGGIEVGMVSEAGNLCDADDDVAYRGVSSANSTNISAKELRELSEFFSGAYLEAKARHRAYLEAKKASNPA